MALSSSDIATLTDFSWSEIKIAAKNAMANSLLGGASLKINGRETLRVTLDQAKEIWQWADTMEQIEAMLETGNTAVAQFGEPS